MRMYIYNVTFITSDWNITTTVRHGQDISEDNASYNVINAAAQYLYQTAKMNVDDFRMVDVDVEYVGEES